MSSWAKTSLWIVPGLITPGQRIDRRDAVAAFPVGVLLAAERRRAAVRPAHRLGTVVGRVHDDGVVRDAELVELGQQLADHAVMLDHAVGVDPDPGLARDAGRQVGPDVHPGRVEPDEERLVGLVRLVDEAFRGGQELAVRRLHALARERAGVLALLLPPGAEARVGGRLLRRRGVAVQDAARAEARAERRVLRVVLVLRLLLGVEVVEVAEELVEAVHRRDVLVAVAEVVLAELAGGVAERLQQLGDGGVRLAQALGRPGQADLGQAGADRRLPGDEGRRVRPCSSAARTSR